MASLNTAALRLHQFQRQLGEQSVDSLGPVFAAELYWTLAHTLLCLCCELSSRGCIGRVAFASWRTRRSSSNSTKQSAQQDVVSSRSSREGRAKLGSMKYKTGKVSLDAPVQTVLQRAGLLGLVPAALLHNS